MKHLKTLFLIVIFIQSFISFGFGSTGPDTLFISNNTDNHFWQPIKDYPFGDKRDNLLDVYWYGDSLIIDGFVGFSQTADKKGIKYSIKNDTVFIHKFEYNADTMYSNNFAVHINCGDIAAKPYTIAYSGFLLNNLNGYDATKELKQTEISGVNKGKFWHQHTWTNAIYNSPLQEPHLLQKNDSLYYIGQAPFYGSNVNSDNTEGFITKEVIFQYGIKGNDISFKGSKRFNSDFGEIDLTLYNFELNLGPLEYGSYKLNGQEYNVQGLPESFCTISPFIQNNYHKDAQQLARLQIWDNPQPYNNQVAIPDTLIKKYLKALQAVYGSGYTCVDSIFQGSHPIKASKFPFISIIIEIPQTESWVNALEVNKPLMGHNELEPLLGQYNYYVESISNTANSTVEIVLKSDSILNNLAMIQQISEQTNYKVDTLYTNKAFIDGFGYPEDWNNLDTVNYTNIRIDEATNKIEFIKILTDGPTNFPLLNVEYSFTFDTTCNAQLLRTHYADFTTATQMVKETKLELSPNPANETLQISGVSANLAYYTIYSLNGVQVLQGRLQQNQINVSSLTGGIYLLQISDHNGQVYHEKFIISR